MGMGFFGYVWPTLTIVLEATGSRLNVGRSYSGRVREKYAF
jgi:hypothetical protein